MTTKSIVILILLSLSLQYSAKAQTINWAGAAKLKHTVNLNLGLEDGFVYGLGYSYRFSNTPFPLAAGLEFSAPAGNTIFDDFKTKFGLQANLLTVHDFKFNAKVQGVFRRYQSSFVRLLNFGSDLSTTIGYYKPKWYVAGEVGFDKAIATHFKHADSYKSQFPGAVDGWSQRATGGCLNYGLQAGFSFTKEDIYLRAGKLLLQDLQNAPSVPMYGQLGVNVKW